MVGLQRRRVVAEGLTRNAEAQSGQAELRVGLKRRLERVGGVGQPTALQVDIPQVMPNGGVGGVDGDGLAQWYDRLARSALTDETCRRDQQRVDPGVSIQAGNLNETKFFDSLFQKRTACCPAPRQSSSCSGFLCCAARTNFAGHSTLASPG